MEAPNEVRLLGCQPVIRCQSANIIPERQVWSSAEQWRRSVSGVERQTHLSLPAAAAREQCSVPKEVFSPTVNLLF